MAHSLDSTIAGVRRRRALTVLLLALAGAVAGWALLTGYGAAHRGERAVELAKAYQEAGSAAEALRSAAHDFDHRHPVVGRRRHANAVVRLRRALAAVDSVAAPGDGADARAVRTQLKRYQRASARALAGTGDRGSARDRWASRREADRIAGAMIAQLRAASGRRRLETLQALDVQRVGQSVQLPGALAVGALAALLLAHPRLRRRSYDEMAAGREELHRLEQAALSDNLTGLRNQRAFQEDMTSELERRNRHGGSVGLIMVDLVGLKQINDNFGHQAGDERIKTVAACLTKTKRASDLAYRIGGDEFAVILPAERAWGAFEFAQRLRRAAEADGFEISVGVTDTHEVEPKDGVIRRADLALIEAKRSQRSVVIYSEAPESRLDTPFEDVAGQHAELMATVLARAVDAKDSSTRSHCETVSELAVRVGKELGLAPARLAQLRLAGLLHDVGKIGIADSILRKPGPLDDDEFAAMRTHSLIGHNIVAAARLPDEAKWVLHHHERPDGRGYPHGLSGDEIPLESRIILVADAFEAITADRHYRPGRPAAEAISELERQSGLQFDPACVEALKRAIGFHGSSHTDGLGPDLGISSATLAA